jgi:hypothetical protein
VAKKKKRETAKKHTRAREKRAKKRKLRLAKSYPKPELQTIHRPALPHMDAPEGFRSISMSQAMIEYGKPLMSLLEDDEKGLEAVVQISMVLWNYSLSVQRGNKDKGIEKDIIEALSNSLGLDMSEAQALLKTMLERHLYLFPQDKQPKDPMPYMFIRKEVRHLIRPFEYGRVILSDEVIPPDQRDRDLIEMINRLDSYIYDDTEFDAYEDLLVSVEDECRNSFERWLDAKGVKENIQDFSFCLGSYLDFIYGYMHDDAVLLKDIAEVYMIEFFEDYLLRKMMVEPHEYVYWPPALKLFYRFLNEKGYLGSHEDHISKIDRIEPYFLEILRKQFS